MKIQANNYYILNRSFLNKPVSNPMIQTPNYHPTSGIPFRAYYGIEKTEYKPFDKSTLFVDYLNNKNPELAEKISKTKPLLSDEQNKNIYQAGILYTCIEAEDRFSEYLDKMVKNKKIKFNIPEISFRKLTSLELAYKNQSHDYKTYMQDILISDAEGKYKDFLFSTKNKYYKSNKNFADDLKCNGIKLNDWLKKSDKIRFKDRKGDDYTVEKMVRNPLKDIFLGNTVDTCIATDRNNFHRILNYLMDFRRQIIVVKDNKDTPVAYTRLYTSTNMNYDLITKVDTTESSLLNTDPTYELKMDKYNKSYFPQFTENYDIDSFEYNNFYKKQPFPHTLV